MKKLTNNQFLNTSLEIENWLVHHEIKNYTIDPLDMSVSVEGSVDLSKKNLKHIPVQFSQVSGFFDCSNNRLKNLAGSPVNVNGFFDCSNNRLKNLAGSPVNVGGEFNCAYNKLINLFSGPCTVDGSYYCHDNALVDFEYIPQQVKNYFFCDNNPQLAYMANIQDFEEIKRLHTQCVAAKEKNSLQNTLHCEVGSAKIHKI